MELKQNETVTDAPEPQLLIELYGIETRSISPFGAGVPVF